MFFTPTTVSYGVQYPSAMFGPRIMLIAIAMTTALYGSEIL